MVSGIAENELDLADFDIYDQMTDEEMEISLWKTIENIANNKTDVLRVSPHTYLSPPSCRPRNRCTSLYEVSRHENSQMLESQNLIKFFQPSQMRFKREYLFVLKPTILSPLLFTVQFGAVVLGPLILSPSAFAPPILNPSVLAPWILSPGIFDPFVLSPYIFGPFVLGPVSYSIIFDFSF